MRMVVPDCDPARSATALQAGVWVEPKSRARIVKPLRWERGWALFWCWWFYDGKTVRMASLKDMPRILVRKSMVLPDLSWGGQRQ